MIYQRTELLIGSENLDKLKKSSVIIFGLGGVGGSAAEALARAGVGEITVVDFDMIDITNLNRQVIATQDTIGKNKAEVMKDRIHKINPNIKVNVFVEKFSKENEKIFFENKKYDYIIDAIDLVKFKLELIEFAKKENIPIISSMGTGNKLNPTDFEVADISKTCVCPLAKVIRLELKKRNIKKLKVVYSKELPKKPENNSNGREKKVNLGSISFVPPVVGMILASEVIKDICKL